MCTAILIISDIIEQMSFSSILDVERLIFVGWHPQRGVEEALLSKLHVGGRCDQANERSCHDDGDDASGKGDGDDISDKGDSVWTP